MMRLGNAISVFQSTLSMRRATDVYHHYLRNEYISIHALHEESDGTGSDPRHGHAISIHALHEESDPIGRPLAGQHGFQSTLSMRRATHDWKEKN